MSFPLAPFICSLPATTLTPVKCQARKGGGSGWKRTNLHGNVDGKRWYSFGNRENFQIQFGDIFLSPPSLTHSTPPCTQTSLPHPSSTSSSELSGATQGVAVGHKTRSDPQGALRAPIISALPLSLPHGGGGRLWWWWW